MKAIAKSMGMEMARRYADIIYPQPVSKQSGVEIAAGVMQRAGLKVKEQEK